MDENDRSQGARGYLANQRVTAGSANWHTRNRGNLLISNPFTINNSLVRIGDAIPEGDTLTALISVRDVRAAARQPREGARDPRVGNRADWEAQRARIAELLHDRVGQAITTLLMEIDRARSENTAREETLDRLEALAREALQGARRVVLDIADGEESRDPMGDARMYSQSTLAISGCELVWEDMPDFRSLPVETARHIAAVIRESVTNIARHAAARTIHVRLVRRGDRVILRVEDDGIGPGALGQRVTKVSFGLREIQAHADALGGTFSIEPRRGGGTVVQMDALVAPEDEWLVVNG